MTMGKKLNEIGLSLPQSLAEVIGPLLICFGEISFQTRTITKMPEEIKEEEDKEKKDPVLSKFQKKEVPRGPDDKVEPPKPIVITLYETSIHDFIQAIEKITDYDHTLYKLELLGANLEEELNKDQPKEEEDQAEEQNQEEDEEEAKSEHESDDIFKSAGSQDGEEEEAELQHADSIAEREKFQEQRRHTATPAQPLFAYSPIPEYEEAVAAINDLQTIPQPSEAAKNAFAVTLFCLETAFESRACDFLKVITYLSIIHYKFSMPLMNFLKRII